MNIDRPDVRMEGRYSMTEAAALLGMHRNSLLNYALQGKLKFGVRKNTGRKYFRGADLLRLWNEHW